jgi:hypothetical protein
MEAAEVSSGDGGSYGYPIQDKSKVNNVVY